MVFFVEELDSDVSMLISLIFSLVIGICICHQSKVPPTYEDLETCLVVLIPGKLDVNGSPPETYCPQDVCDSSEQLTCEDIQQSLFRIFSQERMVQLIHNNEVNQDWVLDALSKHQNPMLAPACSVAIFPKPVKDRTCLMSSLKSTPRPTFMNVSSMPDNIGKINNLCYTFRNSHGSLDKQGLHRDYILNNLFSVKTLKNHVKAEDLYGSQQSKSVLPKCERVAVHSWNQFYNDYLQISKPVVITNALSAWRASSRWSSHYLKERYGNKSVHIKLSPTTDYEGIEHAKHWDPYGKFKIPEKVRSQLEFPDLVVPRPAHANMKFSEYIDLMELIANKTLTNVSAYLEYSSIRQYFPDLEKDISEMPFLNSFLTLKHLNIWLSDGNTLGKLHFDPFDNFLCMIDGRKEVILFEPHDNRMLYEAHIPEAQFSVDLKRYKFRRDKLMESTSMVMSPIDIRNPDFDRFPMFRDTAPLNCTIDEGEVLFMPAFWWHEVQSYPNRDKKRNLAVNYWYEPFLTKEFPCPTCKLGVNPHYYELL